MGITAERQYDRNIVDPKDYKHEILLKFVWKVGNRSHIDDRAVWCKQRT